MEKQKPVIELELYLIRHGESKGNVPRDTQGLSAKDFHDPTLTEKGEKQAKALGKYFENIEFDDVYSSALRRTVQTATELINMQHKKQTLKILPLLTEAGVTADCETDFDTIHAINKDAVLADDYDEKLPLLCYTDADNEKELFKRGAMAINYLRSHYKNGEKIAVVNHAAIMTYLCFFCMGIKDNVPVFDLNFKNTGVTRIVFYKEGTNPYGDIVFDYINSTSHLDKI